MPAVIQRPPGQATTESSGQRVSRPAASVAALRHAPNANFLHMAHPGRWSVMETDRGLELLPQLGKMKLDRGVGGVTNTGDDSHARVHYQKLGWVIIEDEFVDGGYMREHQANGGKLYTTRWETPRMAGSTPLVRTDMEGWWAFLRRVAAEVLPPPEPEILDLHKDVLGARLSRQLEEAEQRPSRAQAAENTQARIEALQAVQAGEPAALAPVVKAKAKGKASKVSESEEVVDAD